MMGPSGCGKTTVGKTLAAQFGWPFSDGDDYHPKADIEKVAEDQALNDPFTVFVQERDSAGNWSLEGSAQIINYQDEDANKAVVEKYNPDTEKWDIVPYIIGYSSRGTHVLLKHDVWRMENGLLPVYYHRPGRGVHSYLYRVDMTGPLVRLHAKV